MSYSLFEKFGRAPGFCAPLFGLFFVASLISCAGNGKPLTESDPQSEGLQAANSGSYTDDYFNESSAAPSGNASNSTRKNAPGAIGSDGFSFTLPAGDWALVGDDDGSAHESGVPYEFYNASTGRRAVLVEIELPKGEPMNLKPRPHGNAEPGI